MQFSIDSFGGDMIVNVCAVIVVLLLISIWSKVDDIFKVSRDSNRELSRFKDMMKFVLKNDEDLRKPNIRDF